MNSENTKQIETERRPIQPVLKGMKVNQVEVFSIAQMQTVRAAINFRQLFDFTKFSTKVVDRTIVVTRIS